MIRAIVFDLDDTLFPETEFVKSGFLAVDHYLFATYGLQNFAKTAIELFEQGDRGNIFNKALDNLDFKYEIGLIYELVTVYREHKPQIHLFEDAIWALNYFKQHKLALITDGYLVTQQNKVNALGVSANFDLIVYSDQYGKSNWKPSPFPYKKVMEDLAVAGKECVYIADNPLKDFVTARKLGWETIQISRKNGVYSQVKIKQGFEADCVLASLYDLKEKLHL